MAGKQQLYAHQRLSTLITCLSQTTRHGITHSYRYRQHHRHHHRRRQRQCHRQKPYGFKAVCQKCKIVHATSHSLELLSQSDYFYFLIASCVSVRLMLCLFLATSAVRYVWRWQTNTSELQILYYSRGLSRSTIVSKICMRLLFSSKKKSYQYIYLRFCRYWMTA